MRKPEDLLERVFNRTPGEKKPDVKIADADKAIKLTGDIARKCLALPDFKIFKDNYERAEATTIDSLIGYTKSFIESPHGDINKYAFTCMRLLTKIEDLRQLGKTIENTAKIGKDDVKSSDN